MKATATIKGRIINIDDRRNMVVLLVKVRMPPTAPDYENKLREFTPGEVEINYLEKRSR